MAYAQKTTSVTNLDATPYVANTAGEGAFGALKQINDAVTPTTGELGSTATKYAMVRVPTNIKVKEVKLEADSALDSSTGLVLDVGVYYSDSTTDGTPAALQGTVVSAALFAAGHVASFKSSGLSATLVLPAAKQNQPLWQAAGLSKDPGGYFDIVVAVQTIATTAASAALNCKVTGVW